MAVTMITGNSTSLRYLNQSQRVIDISDKIYLLEPNVAPLYVLVSKLNKRVTINPQFYWMEDQLRPDWSTLTDTAAKDTTDISASNPTYFAKYDLIKFPVDGEVCLITGIGATQLTAVRGFGTTACATKASGADFFRIGTAFEEGSAYSTLSAKATQVTSATNYCQIFRTAIDITRTAANSELYGGSDRAYQRKKKGIEFMRDLERAFFWGEPLQDNATLDTSITYTRRTTGGIDYYISTNVTAAGGTLTESEFEGFLRSVFRYGSDSRYFFAAPLILSVISQWAQGKLNMFPKDKTYGVNITNYISPHGTLNFVKEVLLEHAGVASATSYYAGYAFALDLGEISYRYLQNRDVTMETDIQLPGDDSYKDQYICEVGMEFHQEKVHGNLTGVTG